MSTTTTKTRKTKKQPRKISVVQPLDASGKNAIVRVTEGKKIDEYFLDRIGSDFGEAFEMVKRDYIPGEEHTYQIGLNVKASTCCCKGFTYCGHCRHLEGITALKNAGKL